MKQSRHERAIREELAREGKNLEIANRALTKAEEDVRVINARMAVLTRVLQVADADNRGGDDE